MQYVIEMLHYEYFIVLICLMLFYLNIEFDEVIVINSIMQEMMEIILLLKLQSRALSLLNLSPLKFLIYQQMNWKKLRITLVKILWLERDPMEEYIMVFLKVGRLQQSRIWMPVNSLMRNF